LIGRLLCAVFAVATLVLYPAAALTAAAPGSATHIVWHSDGLLTWQRVEHRAIPPHTTYHLTRSLSPGHSKVISDGSWGVLEERLAFAQRGGGPVRRRVLSLRILRAPRPRIVADGIPSGPLSSFEARGVASMALMARSAIEMLATAYTAECAGCGGMTAIGRRAGYGIVAVDPRVIPLGTRLYIQGYGLAVAGDTGGSIVGRRIDLGFDSIREAMLFGRRPVTVYRLK
jgi:3D (Asp-Asp-Asp) domain-containing protein